MTLPSPNLDDRDFRQLLEEATRRIPLACRDWTDLTPSDPGIVLLELFAHLTETMIYRLNRVPEKAYVEFLRLIGVKLYPPAAASALLTFNRGRGDSRLEIPAGTRVAAERAEDGAEPAIFTTATRAAIEPGETSTEVLAFHCELVEGELGGLGTGAPGLSVVAKRPPFIAPTGNELDLVVGVEVTGKGVDSGEELDERTRAITHEGKTFRIWREVDNFANLQVDRHVYVVDRVNGTVQFAPAARVEGEEGLLEEAPAALAEVPPSGSEIRLWYRHGGGRAGNVAAEMLTVLKDPIPGVQVTNLSPATGGRAVETIENALVRGPQELHGLQRVVTARDFELLAIRSSGAVARAHAFTKSALWAHALPGTVQVTLVPDLPHEERSGGRVAKEQLRARESQAARDQVEEALAERRALGTTCLVDWAHYKTVRVKARIVVYREENLSALKRRILERLHLTINPLISRRGSGAWRFGEALRKSNIYDIVLSEPGVKYADDVRLLVDNVPNKNVSAVSADAFQERTWYVAAGDTLFRSLNDGEGWESAVQVTDETIRRIETHPERSGLLAVAVRPLEGEGSRVLVSHDCG